MFATKQLRDEHEGILIMLSVLEKICIEIQNGRVTDYDHPAKIVDFLRTFADKCHHGKEEELLFPALADAGVPVNGGPIGVMLSEHTQGRAYIKAMADVLVKLHENDADARETFVKAALGYVTLLRDHIAKENNVLFVMAENRLTADEHEKLAVGFDKIEEERIGEGVHEKYHALLRQLRDIYL